MTEWREYKLSDVMEIIGGGTPKTSVQEYWNGNIPWLSVADFNNANRYVYVAEKHITELGLKNSSTKILKKGQLIISARGTVGAIAQLGCDMAFNQSCYGLTANSLSTNDFLFYLLKQCIEELKQQSNGGVFDTIIRETFDNIIISLPPLPEQKAIAEVLSSLDDKIDLLTRQNKTLEDLGQAFFRKWFVEDASEDWEVIKLEDILESIESGSRPKGGIDPELVNGVPSIGAESINGLGVYDFSKTKYVTRDFFNNMRRGVVKSYDVLVYKDGAYVGRKGMFGNDFPFAEFAVNEHVFILRSNEKAGQIFLYFLLQEEELAQLNSNSAQPGLNQQAMKTYEIVLPPKKLINDFEAFADPLIDKIFENAKQMRTLQKLRDTLLPKLISGEVRVKM
jgi:type I restriction enzyme S subunit